MVARIYAGTREDGVRLYDHYAVKRDENGFPMRDANRIPIPSGFKIRKLGTDELYDVATDVESAPFKYVVTDIPVDPPAEEVQEPSENEADSTTVQT